jgi:hypothetical protein
MREASHAAAPAARVCRWRSRRGNAALPLPSARPRDRVVGVKHGTKRLANRSRSWT